jgi:hypothetical protein
MVTADGRRGRGTRDKGKGNRGKGTGKGEQGKGRKYSFYSTPLHITWLSPPPLHRTKS